ncbi:transposase [Sinorhizobium meliloti]|uniref:Transposase IS3/IS911 family protein n=1 Tax=Sinorhizobium meliloti CCNWSX0020 TaxID=1107881 RepID=H0G858_RHIML|nr:transposase IS3/IS911 family protein [Sinorhizobium meliloti CCNWSX0020]
MKASQFSDAQKAFILKQGDEGVRVAEICRKEGISHATYFNWKKKYAGLLPPEIRKLKQLEDENARLKKIVADLTMDREMLQNVIRRSFKACSEAGGGEGYVPGLDDLDPACSRRFGLQRRQEIANGVRLPVNNSPRRMA